MSADLTPRGTRVGPPAAPVAGAARRTASRSRQGSVMPTGSPRRPAWAERRNLLYIAKENGAGQSNAVPHPHQASTGTRRGPDRRVDGRPVQFASPRQAIEAGICMVHQQFRLVERFTVAERHHRSRRPPARSSRHLLVAAACEVEAQAAAPRSDFGLPGRPSPGSLRLRLRRWASNGGSRSSRRCTRTHASSSSTSRPRCSPPKRPRRCFAPCGGWRPRAERSSSSRTSSRRSWRSDRVTVFSGRAAGGDAWPPRSIAGVPGGAHGRARGRVRHPIPRPEAGRGARARARGRLGRRHWAGRRPRASVAGAEVVAIAGVSGNGQRELSEAIAGLQPRPRRRQGGRAAPAQRARQPGRATRPGWFVLTDWARRGAPPVARHEPRAWSYRRPWPVPSPGACATGPSGRSTDYEIKARPRAQAGDPRAGTQKLSARVCARPAPAGGRLDAFDVAAVQTVHRLLLEAVRAGVLDAE